MSEPNTTPTAPKSAVVVDSEDLIALVSRTFASAPIVREDGSSIILVANGDGGIREVTLPALTPNLPGFITARQLFVEPDSFSAYVASFATDTSIIIADIRQRQFTALLDYHDASAKTQRHNAHIATLDTPYDDDWDAWRNRLNKPMAQMELADFLEDYMHTIADPDAGELLDMVNTIRINRSTAIAQVRNERNGTIKVQFDETDAADVLLPDTVTLQLPIFQGTPEIEITAKLRYRVDRNTGLVSFILAVPSVSRIERTQFRMIGDALGTDLNLPVLYGVTPR